MHSQKERYRPFRVSSLHFYPVKSCRGIQLEQAVIDARGIKNDREFMLVDASGRFLTQRSHPKMALIEAFLERDEKDEKDTWLTLSAPDMPLKSLRSTLAGSRTQVVIWQDRCEAIDQGDEVAAWLSAFLDVSCRLVHMPADFVRKVDTTYAPREQDQVSFADGFPFLLLSSASLQDLNARLPQPVKMNRFRPNIVVSGTSPFAEDSWKRIRINSVEFDLVKPCARCVITTIEQQNGIQGRKEPLRTLASYRFVAGRGVLFGQNLVHRNKGIISVGDEVHVLEYQTPLVTTNVSPRTN
jgi:uncharacterized protein